MKKLILFIILSVFSLTTWAEIQIEVNPAQVTTGQQFQLTLTQENPQTGGIPDLTALQKDFVILGTEQQINYAIINGQTQSASQWIISLKALKSGILTIPAIKVGQEQSNPITINVTSSKQPQNSTTNNNSSAEDALMLTAEVDEKKPYVNQQILYTVKLYNSKRLLDAEYQGPQVDNALLIPLGDAKRYQTIKNGINYVVEEQNYAIFPQKSGPLSIASPTFTALVYDIDPQRLTVQDKPINLTVQPIPPQFKGKLWLPAKQVKISEKYENAEQTLSQGSTLTRTVILEGVAIPAQLLPTLDFAETDAFSVYPEKGANHNQVKQGELIGSTEIKVTYLFNKAGNVTIPELQLPWFNTQTGKKEIAVLPPRSMQITPAPVATPNNSVPRNEPNKVVSQSDAEHSIVPPTKQWGWLVALLFAAAWLVTLGLWGWQKHARHSGTKSDKKALHELNKACNEADPKKARDALLKWAALNWPDASLLNLTDLTQIVRDIPLKKQIHILSQALYKNEGKNLWRGDELMRAVLAAKNNRGDRKRKANILPPINPA